MREHRVLKILKGRLTIWLLELLWTKILFCRKEMSLIRVRGFFISTIYSLFFISHTIAGFLSVATLVFTEHSLTSFTVFTLLSILANIKFFVTTFGDSLIWIADSMIALRRMQRLLETKPVIKSKISKRQNMSPLKVYFKGRRYKPHLVRTESFKPGKPALMSLQKIKDFQAVQPQAVLENISSLWNYSSDRPALQNVSLQASIGQFTSVVSMDSVSVSVQFIVVKKGQCLLEYSTAVDLGVLRVNKVPGPVTENCNVMSGHFCREPKNQVS